MQYRRLLVALPADLYEALEQAADASDRVPAEQARAIIRGALQGQRVGQS